MSLNIGHYVHYLFYIFSQSTIFNITVFKKKEREKFLIQYFTSTRPKSFLGYPCTYVFFAKTLLHLSLAIRY